MMNFISNTDTGEFKPIGPAPRNGICPSCHTPTKFTFVGIQKWPERVAVSLGIDREVSLWECHACHTTLTFPKDKAES